MNGLWFGFDENDDRSPLGVHIQMAHSWHYYCDEGCFNGFADCRLSASLYNHKVMVNNETGAIQLTMKRPAGIALNQWRMENEWRKCSYMWDGASFNRYNGACGCAGESNDCDHPKSAYGNDCAGRPCGPDSGRGFDRCLCDTKLITSSLHPRQCIWKGTAINPNGNNPKSDQTREMLKERLKHQHLHERPRHDENNMAYWNEIVVDVKQWARVLKEAPEDVVLAFVYRLDSNTGKRQAVKMRQTFVSMYNPKVIPPLVAIDVWAQPDETQDIFLAEPES